MNTKITGCGSLYSGYRVTTSGTSSLAFNCNSENAVVDNHLMHLEVQWLEPAMSAGSLGTCMYKTGWQKLAL
jgi:hypothetical protein